MHRKMDQASKRIGRFLDDYSRGQLTVCVGYASLAGFAWLLEQITRNNYNAISIIVGKLDETFGYEYSDHHASFIRDFFTRFPHIDVQVFSASQDQGLMHTKIFLVNNDEGSFVLQGSANLTHSGLFVNTESMSEVPIKEVPDFLIRVENVLSTAEDATKEFNRYLISGRIALKSEQGKIQRLVPKKPQIDSSRTQRIVAMVILFVVGTPVVAFTTNGAINGAILALVFVGVLEVYLRRSKALEG